MKRRGRRTGEERAKEQKTQSETVNSSAHAHSTSQQKGTEFLTHSAVACWRWGSDSHGRREAGPVSDARLQADHRSSAAVKECGQSTFFPRFVSERGTTSAHPPLHTRSQPPSLSCTLSLNFPLSLSLIVCDGNAIAMCRVCMCVLCVYVYVSECLKQRGLVLFRQRRTDGGNLPTASPSAFLLIHIQRELQPCAAFYREAPSVSNHPAPLPSVTHTHTLAHIHTKAFFLVAPPPPL